jgi:RimJ/RimL family protein N-acetyltransferase
MRLHVEALYRHVDSRMQSINQWQGGVAPRFFLGRTAEGNLPRFGTDLPDELARKLEELCLKEPSSRELAPEPVHLPQYLSLLGSHAPIDRIWTGPAYWFSKHVTLLGPATVIREENADLLRGGLESWLPDVPHRRPFLAIVEDGRAVSVCASVRITQAAHEAGVETLPSHRGRGHARSAVAAWANAVRATGAIPLYSTSFDNRASRAVARSLGLVLFGIDFHVT